MTACRGRLRLAERRRRAAGESSISRPQVPASRWLAAGSVAAAVTVSSRLPGARPRQAACAATQNDSGIGTGSAVAAVAQPLIRIPEIVSQGGQLRGTIVLHDPQMQRLAFKQGDGSNRCAPQRVRSFVGVNAVLPDYPGEPPPGYGGVPPIPVNQTADPVPGPTLRARVGDLVQLTFLNQINPNEYGELDRSRRARPRVRRNRRTLSGTGHVPGLLPRLEHRQYPFPRHAHEPEHDRRQCLHRGAAVAARQPPAGRHARQASREPFEEFFANCERELTKNVSSQWPRVWSDLPRAWTSRRKRC